MFLVDSKSLKKGSDEVVDHIKALISKSEGKVVEFGKWDERKLAYEIKGTVNGTYYLCYFTGGPDTITVLNRECELSPLVLRALFLKIAAIPDFSVNEPESKPDEEHEPEEKSEGRLEEISEGSILDEPVYSPDNELPNPEEDFNPEDELDSSAEDD